MDLLVGVDSGSSADEIQRAIRSALLRYHPDRSTGNAAKFMRIKTFRDSLAANTPVSPPSASNLPVPPIAAVVSCVGDTKQHISKTVTLSFEQSFLGAVVPVMVERKTADGQKEHEQVYVRFEPGVDSGEIVTIPGKGVMGGDLRVSVLLEFGSAWSDYSRAGIDLVLRRRVSLREALCGGTFTIQHPCGKPFEISSRQGAVIRPGQRQVIPKKGYTREGHTGNLIIEFSVEFPDKVSAETVEVLRGVL